ncbi:MFS transporter [Bosea sp. (in: a-proteobacteria)]|jgi:DHA1 family purine ribonucleoside efflux pump-like MFS transporter|uniref:MFS transporter n=1 Tax=Bosea sp. (in: a-proteobacteria) TaxID=1871050 RepID=UPI002DDD4D6A|nr:MFS transporter [Bosea sp. (in: a-proteobacteria)]HEV2511090.1 MFS transporter [Bosea sp. (in: a-proteobacteria)]
MSDSLSATADAELVGIVPEERTAVWPAVFALSMGVFALVSAEFLPASVLTSIAADLSISVGAAGQTVTVTSLVGVAAAIFTPIVTSRFDRRLVLWSLLSLLALSSLVTALANGFLMLLAARFLLGLALGGFWSMAPALTLRLVPAQSVPRALALISAGVSAAFIGGGPLGAYLDSLIGWRAVFGLSAALAGVALLALLATMPSLPPQAAPRLGTLGVLLSRPSIRLMLISVLVIISGQFTGFTYIRPFLEHAPQLGVAAITIVLLGYGLGNVVGNFAGGAVAGRGVKLAIVSFALAIGVLALVMLQFGASPIVAGITVALWGFAFGFAPVGFQTWMVRVAADHAESASGLVTAAFLVAIASGAVLGGLLVNHVGGLGPIGYMALATLAGALLVLVAGKEPPRP